jgi:ABC-2 type transport system ATP-binding protein
VLVAEGLSFQWDNPNQLTVDSGSTDRIGELAARRLITIHELSLLQASLEEAFMELTHDSLSYQAERLSSSDGRVAQS